MKKVFFSTTIAIALLAICLFVSAYAVPTSVYARADDQTAYPFDPEDAKILFDGATAAVYFVTAPDVDFEYVFTFGEGEETYSKTTKAPYCVADKEYSCVTVTVTRGEDDEYAGFENTFSPVVKNTDLTPAKLPAGQRTTYSAKSYTCENVVFYKDGEAVEATDAGVYSAKIACETPFEIVFFVDKAEITVTSNSISCRYDRYPDDLPEARAKIIGHLTEEESDYVKEHTSFSFDTPTEVIPGEYTVVTHYDGEPSDNYTVTTKDSTLKITNGALYGFSLFDENVLYDGKPHSLAVAYDSDKWEGVTTTYTLDSATECGKYKVTATISKEHYDDLVLTAYLIIRTPNIESNNLADRVVISGSTLGFDPTTTIVLSAVDNDYARELAEEELTSDGAYVEQIKGIYKITAFDGTEAVSLNDEECTIRLKIDGLEKSDGVRLFTYRYSALVETEYTFENGYFIIKGSPADSYVFIEKTVAETDNTVAIIYTVIIGIVIVFALLIIVDAFRKHGKTKKYWRKKHRRWV